MEIGAAGDMVTPDREIPANPTLTLESVPKSDN
jgi:hypothetical protein